jgi:hypothetical protein
MSPGPAVQTLYEHLQTHAHAVMHTNACRDRAFPMDPAFECLPQGDIHVWYLRCMIAVFVGAATSCALNHMSCVEFPDLDTKMAAAAFLPHLQSAQRHMHDISNSAKHRAWMVCSAIRLKLVPSNPDIHICMGTRCDTICTATAR